MSITGERLRALRKERDMSQEEVAKRIGISRPAYVNYEAGKSRPVRKLSELSALFNVTTDYLLGKSDAPNGIVLSSPADITVKHSAPADLAPTDIPINELIKELFSDRPDVLSVLCTVTVNRDTINDRPLSNLDDGAKEMLRATLLNSLEQQGLIEPQKKKFTLSDLTPEERQELKRELYQEEVRKKQERKKEAQSAPYTSDEIAK